MNRLIFRSMITALVLFVLFCVPSIASADGTGAILWTLSGVAFNDGGMASGSFDYNAATNMYSNIDITTTAGSAFGGATYTTLSGAFPGSSTSTSLFLGASSGSFTGPLLLLFFDAPLINSGGTVTAPLTTGLDFGGGEGSLSTEARFITGGAATSTVVTPEPSALSLLGVGLAALLAGAVIRKVSQA